jgi:hypothetical protein
MRDAVGIGWLVFPAFLVQPGGRVAGVAPDHVGLAMCCSSAGEDRGRLDAVSHGFGVDLLGIGALALRAVPVRVEFPELGKARERAGRLPY